VSWLRTPDESELPEDVLALFEQPREKLGFIPNVLRLFALRPSHLVLWDAHYNELMKGPSGLSKAEREMIAVVVSVANECRYCISAHSAALRKLTRDPALADAIAADHTAAPLEPRAHAMLDYALKLTLQPTQMTAVDVRALRDVGWTDEDVMDIAEVTGMFNLTNRMASGLGWEPNPEYDSLGR
jgi:uncharacterized peroxidase-related enzyme